MIILTSTGLRRFNAASHSPGHAVHSSGFAEIVRVVYSEKIGKGVIALVGFIDLSTSRIIERLRYPYDVGFRVFQISLPCWDRLNASELLTFIKDVCGFLSDSKFLHYNLGRTGRVLTANDCDEVPKLVATKNTVVGFREAISLMRKAPECSSSSVSGVSHSDACTARVFSLELICPNDAHEIARIIRVWQNSPVRQAYDDAQVLL